MKKIKKILNISVLLVCGVANTWGQGGQKLTGKILSATNQPVEGAIFLSEAACKRKTEYCNYIDSGKSI